MPVQKYPNIYISEPHKGTIYTLERAREDRRCRKLVATAMPAKVTGDASKDGDVVIPLRKVPLAIRNAARTHLFGPRPMAHLAAQMAAIVKSDPTLVTSYPCDLDIDKRWVSAQTEVRVLLWMPYNYGSCFMVLDAPGRLVGGGDNTSSNASLLSTIENCFQGKRYFTTNADGSCLREITKEAAMSLAREWDERNERAERKQAA
jgi:hypothetical protein